MAEYWWRPKPEVVRMLVIAFIGVLLQYIINYDPETVTDLQTYVLAALVAAVQAAATAVLALLGPGGFSK